MKFVRNEKGQSMVETALLLPILLLVLVGMFDFGKIFYEYTHLHLAAQETVRVGGLGGSDAEMVAFAKNYVHIEDPNQLQIDISPQDYTRKSGDYLTIKLEYPVNYMTPFISNFLPSSFMIHTESTIRVE